MSLFFSNNIKTVKSVNNTHNGFSLFYSVARLFLSTVRSVEGTKTGSDTNLSSSCHIMIKNDKVGRRYNNNLNLNMSS